MNTLALFSGALFGCLAIIFGAFGAHALKKKLTQSQLQSFETGVKYQMYHAILLVILGFNLPISSLNKTIIYLLISGIMLFSFSIYGLVFASAKQKKIKVLGPITPLGGLLLVIAWGLLCYQFLVQL